MKGRLLCVLGLHKWSEKWEMLYGPTPHGGRNVQVCVRGCCRGITMRIAR